MKTNKEILIAALILVLIAGYFLFQNKAPSKQGMTPTIAPTSAAPTKGTTTYSLSTLEQHNNETDCWMAIDGKVYDVTSYVPNHNKELLKGCGKEATQLFDEVKKHTGKKPMLDQYFIGTLE